MWPTPFYRDVVRGQSDSEVRAYIDNCYREVRAVQHGIEQRNGTLLSISKLLLDRQRDFFLYGKPSLRTLRQSDISGALGLHESTVSRAIKDKSLQCRWGTFPLKYFFSVNLDGSSPQAQVDPRELIKRLIEEEPPSAPLSDQKLADEVCPPRHRDIPPHRHQIPARHGHRALPRRGRNINNIRGPGQLQGPGSAKT